MATEQDRVKPAGAGGLLFSHRTAESRFDLYSEAQPVPEKYIDGVARVAVGPIVSRVSFYSTADIVEENGLPVENRVVTSKLVVPTAALAEFCAQVLQSLRQNETQLTTALNQTVKTIAAAAESKK